MSVTGAPTGRRVTTRHRASSVPTPQPRLGPGSLVGLALVLTSPLVVVPGLAQPYLLPKVAWAAVGLVLVLVAPRRTRLDTAVAWAVAALGAVLFLAALGSAVPNESLLGRFPRFEGVAMAGVYVSALVAGARLRCEPGAWMRWVPRVLAPVSGVMLLAALVNLASPDAERVGGLMGSASILGSWSALVCVLLLGMAVTPTGPRSAVDRWIAPFGIAASTAVLVVSGSRAAALGWALGVALVAALAQGAWLRAWPAWAALLGTAALASVLLPLSIGRFASEGGIAQSTTSGRVLLWQDSWELVTAHPLLGVGPSGFVDAVPAFHSVQWASTVGPANPPDSPHSIVLQVLVAGGALALAAATVLVVLAGRTVVRQLGDHRPLLVPLVAAVAAYGVSLLFGFTDPVVTTLACLLAGFAVAVSVAGVGPSLRAHALRWVPAVVCGLVALVAVGGIASERALARGFDALSRGDATAAQDSFDSALVPTVWRADVALRAGHALRVGAESGLVDPSSCLDATRDARQALPSSVEAAVDAAVCAEMAGDLGAAWRHIDDALALDPNNVDLLLELGVIAARAGDPEQAEAAWMRATQLRPATQQAWVNLARLYEQLGRTENAASAVRKAQEITGTSGS